MHIESRLEFSEYLKKLSPTQVFELLDTEGTQKNSILSTNRLTSIAKENISKEKLEERFKRLSDSAAQVAIAVYLSGNCGVEVDFSESIRVELLNSLLVYSITTQKNEEYLLGFSDCDTKLTNILFEKAIDFFAENCPEETSSFYSYRIISDLLIILHLANRESLKLKKDGDYMQATIDALSNQLHIAVDTTQFSDAKTSIRDITKFLISFAESIGILYLDAQIYRPVFETVDNWLLSPPEQLFLEIKNYLKSYIGNWNNDLLQKIINSTYSFNTSSAIGFSNNNVELGIQLMYYAGEFGAVTNDEITLWGTACQKWDCDNGPTSVVIMPDFSVLVSQMASPEILNQFLLVGDIKNLDGVYKGTLNKEALFNSLATGIKDNRIYEFLERWGAPSNITTTVKEWIHEFSRVSMIEGSAVVVGDSSTAQVLSKHPELMELVEEVEVKTLFSVKKGSEKRVTKMLSELGFDIRIKGENATQKNSYNLNEILSSENKNDNFIVVTEFAKKETAPVNYKGGGKYSSDMKKLDLNELHNVVEYAKLMDLSVRFVYSGSENLKSGEYKVIPLKIVSTDKGYIEGKSEDSKETRLFLIEAIEKLAVIE